MGRGINKVILVGNLGSDPEIRQTNSGSPVANLSVATTRSWQNKQTGELQNETQWHRVTVFGKTAETASKYLTKGSQVYIEGRLQTRKWQDHQGHDRWTTEVVCHDMQMLGKSGDASPETREEVNAGSRVQTNEDCIDEIPF